VALGASGLDSTSAFGQTDGTDVSFGGVLGYRWDLAAGQSIGVEGTADFFSGERMSCDLGADACTSVSPDWCGLDSIARLRGVYGVTLGNRFEVFSMAGVSMVNGLAEDGPGVFVDTGGTGYTLGLGAQKAMGTGTLRVELTYDRLGNTDADVFEKNLEVISLRSSFLF
jgi:opacity protein-like surface antigen